MRQAGFSAHVERLRGDYGGEGWTRVQLLSRKSAPRRQESSSLPERRSFGGGGGRKVRTDTETTKSSRKLPVCDEMG